MHSRANYGQQSMLINACDTCTCMYYLELQHDNYVSILYTTRRSRIYFYNQGICESMLTRTTLTYALSFTMYNDFLTGTS